MFSRKIQYYSWQLFLRGGNLLAILIISYIYFYIHKYSIYIIIYSYITYYILINTSGLPEKVLTVLSKKLPREDADIQMSMEELQAL